MSSSGVSRGIALLILSSLGSTAAVPRRSLRVSEQQPVALIASANSRHHERDNATYLPKNYTEAMAKHQEELHKQVFNTSVEATPLFKAGKERREKWNEEQRILHELMEKRLKNITTCLAIETKNETDRFKVCNDTRTKNNEGAAKDPPVEPVPEPEQCTPYHNVYEFCDQPPVPVNISQGNFGNELMEVARLHEELEAALAGWIERAHNEEIQVLDEVRRYYSQKSRLNAMKDVKSAKDHALKAVESQKAVIQKLINAREAAFAEDKKWFGAISKKAVENVKKVCEGNTTETCAEPKLRIALEAEEDTIETSNWALFRHDKEKEEKFVENVENSPWALPALRDFLAYLPNETADINSASWPHEDSWFKGPKLPNMRRLNNPGWHWDERRANDMAVMDGLETVLQTGERYFDYQFANLLLHLGTRKAQITELRIQPALREVGLLPVKDPDMSGTELIQKEIDLLYKLAVTERKYHWEEQSRIWSLKPFLDAAIRDMDRPQAVYKWCQITSLRWYKCRQSARQLLDYLQDTSASLNEAAKPLRDIRNEISYKYDPLYKDKDWVATPVDEMNRRLKSLYDMWQDLGQAEAMAQGDGNTDQMEAMKTQMNAALNKAHTFMEPLFSTAAQWSRKFQLRTVQRIIELMDKKQEIIENFFYAGDTDMASRNRDAFKRMTAPDLWLMNITGLGAGRPIILNAEGARVVGAGSEDSGRFLSVPPINPALTSTSLFAKATDEQLKADSSLKEFKQGGLQTVLKLLHQTAITDTSHQ